MSEIKDVRYFYNGDIYRFNGNLFDRYEVENSVSAIQLRDYAEFADEINSEGGWLEVHLSHNDLPDGIEYDTRVVGVSHSLDEKIRQSLGLND